MWESGYYPPGAEHDPSAPWNQVDLDDIYGDDATQKIDEEIDDHDDNFIDFCCDNEYLGEDYTDEDLEQCARDENIRNEYHDYRYDDMVQELAETAADERDYYESERYEAERERYLLGED